MICFYLYLSRQRSAQSQEPDNRAGVEQGKDVLTTSKYDESQMATQQWDRGNKYRGVEDPYLRDGTSFSTMDRESRLTGSSGYKTGVSEDPAYYEQDFGHGGHFRQHIYESPQFS